MNLADLGRKATIKTNLNALQEHFTVEANTMNLDRSSLIWVHNVCDLGYQSTQADVTADDNCRAWR